MSGEHTPWRAWATDGTLWVGGENGYSVEFEDGDDAVEAARRYNHHAELVEALRETTKWADQFAKQMEMYDVSEEAKEAVSDARTLMAKLDADQ